MYSRCYFYQRGDNNSTADNNSLTIPGLSQYFNKSVLLFSATALREITVGFTAFQL